MKIKFTEDINLVINDYNFGDEYITKINKGDEKEIVEIEDDTHGYKSIHFAHKEIAESVHHSAFVIIS